MRHYEKEGLAAFVLLALLNSEIKKVFRNYFRNNLYLARLYLCLAYDIKLSEVIFIWFSALSSTLYPALIEFIGFCFICSFCLSFLLPEMISLSDLKTILTLSSTSYGCAVY